MNDFRYLNGRRATLTRATGDYPIRPVPAGSSGTLVVDDIDPSQVALQLDETHDDLREWNNQLDLSTWSDNDPFSCIRLEPNPSDAFTIYYTSWNEKPCTMLFAQLLDAFATSETRHWPDDMRADLTGQGWYEGEHESGRYLVINLERMQLAFKGGKRHVVP